MKVRHFLSYHLAEIIVLGGRSFISLQSKFARRSLIGPDNFERE